MKPLYRNLFLAIGVVAIVIMLCTSDISYPELWANVRRAGYWFPAVIFLWVFLYLANALAWSLIINDGERPKVPFWRIYKYTISGYALNYVTPVGLLGGEPYRIMELTPYVGASKATSSVILYAMIHIFSHFCFWSFSILLYLLLYGTGLSVGMALFLAICAAFCATGIYFFFKGYKNGLAMKVLRVLAHIPGLKSRLHRFMETREESIKRVDAQIAALHSQRKSTFYLSLFTEFSVRLAGCLEIQFILLILTDHVSFWDCVLIQAFTSLSSNLFFFVPMGMGAREGGFALAVGGLSLAGAYGVYTGLIVRLRELIWIAIGLLLIKLGNRPVVPSEKK
ncbi:MAG: flippase-like domain-containing protein [Paraprevotella sp.]|nr:flippase-like domain-containing protein [Paraprevotella sp.]